MRTITVLALRGVLALALAGSLVVQVVMVPLFWADLAGAPDWFRVSLVVLVVLGIVTLQVVAVCVWRLLAMVRRGTVFSPAAFRYVDAIIAAIAAAAVLVLGVAVVLAPTAAAPGVVGLVCGAALVVAGVALVVYVQRTLLAQAVDRDAEARALRSELDEVI
ncbi:MULTISPECIES: DUF2975 domain-containing protein [Micrococcaceae]|jgi:hypothetical protein|uniref:DUF2975 domain-containing protein n=1 Tax=Micrococcaceae TaxID=1268 RepID=UPI00160B9A9B|nr:MULTISPECIES: DUF2975 domain-containing protein [Micrococcaceae]MBB5748758.1 hypothetical protein [Micrococcus sp. TA1]HRO29029.1 DUF2975 domain-containing protein [Citricoccus sp.]HRO93385.1 DUF2975 domain-containing protein [Citricoccus sp.]